MRLLTTAGAYAGQIRDYGTAAGLAALRSGTARPLEAPLTARPPATPVPEPARPIPEKRRKK